MSCFGHLKLKIISGVRLRVFTAAPAARCFRRGVRKVYPNQRQL